MEAKVNFNTIYAPSENVVAREIQGEFIIVPLTSGIGDSEEEIFSLNETARAIWDKLEGKKSLKNIAIELSEEFAAPLGEIEKDCLGLGDELLKRKMIVKI